MTENPTIPRTTFSLWLQAARPFSYSASVIPVLVGAMAALHFEGEVLWWLFPIVLIASVLLHIGTNLVSEYFDYAKGVDRDETFGSSRVLVEKLLEPKAVLWTGYLCFAVGFILGLVLVYFRGTPMLALGIIGILGGIFYTGWPIGYKYFGLGDLLVFALMGPLMVIGSYFSLTGTFNIDVLYMSLPIGFLVAAILNANNLRDIMHDTNAGIKTMANLIGLRASKIEYYILVSASYVSIIVMVLMDVLEPWALIVLLSLPPSIKNIKLISKAQENKPEEVSMIDVMTAQHHLLFGLLLSIGLILSAIF